MAATYSGDPSSSDVDLVRFLLGDTDVADARLQDGEIAYLLDTWAHPMLAAAEGAQVLANTAAHWMSYSADGTSMTLDQLQAKYSLMSDQLRAMYRRNNRAAPWNAEANRSDWESYAADESVKHGGFAIDMDRNNRTEGTYGGATQEDLRGQW